jgi:HSP20 family protein
MDLLFRRFFGEPVMEGNGHGPYTVWSPRVNVEETEKEILVTFDLPGVDAKELNITVENNILVLSGERKEEKEEKKRNYHRFERFFGEFYREVPLPIGADTEKIAATFTKGVVTITIPKKVEVLPKKIAVKTFA